MILGLSVVSCKRNGNKHIPVEILTAKHWAHITNLQPQHRNIQHDTKRKKRGDRGDTFRKGKERWQEKDLWNEAESINKITREREHDIHTEANLNTRSKNISGEAKSWCRKMLNKLRV